MHALSVFCEELVVSMAITGVTSVNYGGLVVSMTIIIAYAH